MTQIVATLLDKSSPKEAQLKLFQSIEGAANADGSWKKGWEPGIQTFVRKEGMGDYVIVHNLNRLDYSLSVSLLTQPGSFEISEQREVSFRLKTTLNKEPFDSAFRFAISIYGDK